MIFIEGPDNSGKTTLCEAIKSLGIETSHRTKEGTSNRINFDANVQLTRTQVVFDRSRVISEIVYGSVIRGKVNVNEGTIANFLNTKPLVIYCRPEDWRILSNKGRSQMEGVLSNHSEIIQQYDDVMASMKRYGVRVHEYDYAQPGSVDSALRVIQQELQHQFELKCASKVFANPQMTFGVTKRDLASISEVQKYQVSKGKQ